MPNQQSRSRIPKNVLNAREVAAYLGVHLTTIYRLLKEKEIPAFRVGADWRFNLESIDSWRRAREHEVGGNKDGKADLGRQRKESPKGVQDGPIIPEPSGSGLRK